MTKPSHVSFHTVTALDPEGYMDMGTPILSVGTELSTSGIKNKEIVLFYLIFSPKKG